MTILLPLIYIALVILHSAYHWWKIEEKNKLITSTQKIIEWSVISILAGVLLIPFYQLLPIIIYPIITRLAFFDITLNLMRGKSWLYEGAISKSKSLWDFVESRIGMPIWIFRVIYILMFLAYLIFTPNECITRLQ